MLNEFYNYIANNTLSYFQGKVASIRPGERYCLKLDTEEMVKGVDSALRKRTQLDNIQGTYQYGSVYSTFTIQLSANIEVVIASKINGMTDDFLATLRNAELSDKHFPILMITHSAIDSITSGTGDLSANGMPFHASSIISNIKENIQDAQLSVADKTFLETELNRKQTDRFSDKSSLYEYSDLLTVLGRGFVQEADYPSFSLLSDPDAKHIVDESKIKARLEENHKLFELIDRIFKHGNISDALEKEFDRTFVEYLETCKKKNIPWYRDYTYAMVKSSQDKLRKKLDNPLKIDDNDFEIYSGSAIEYSYLIDTNVFMRDDGESKNKHRKKNIIIYNPDGRKEVSVSIQTNIAVKQSCIESIGAAAVSSPKKIIITIKPEGCSFSTTTIMDLNNDITYKIKICVIDIVPKYFEAIQTSFLLKVPKNIKKASIQVFGLTKELVVNPRCSNVVSRSIENNGVYECSYSDTLRLLIGEEDIDTDTGYLDCTIKCGPILIPLQIQDEPIKPVELTGIGAFKWKYHEKRSLEYREGKIISGTTEFFTKEPYRSSLATENVFIQNGWLAIADTIDGEKEYILDIPNSVKSAYIKFLEEFKNKRILPSLAYYKDRLRIAANNYVKVVEALFEQIPAGQTLTPQQNNVLLLGCVIKSYDERTISMSPLHPLNVLYQLSLMEENGVGEVRDNLVEKLSALYLLPYIKDSDKNLYHAIEQKHSPEWRMYAQISNKRYQGARNYVQKLVCDKIMQYKEHFSFLFDDIGNNQLCINLINMGDCREIFQGLIRFYTLALSDGIDPDDLLHFVVNVYSEHGTYNEFSILSDQHKLKEYLKGSYGKDFEDVSEMALILTGNIRCFFRNPLEQEYQYAHLTFYEMASSEETGASRMDSITTGISLEGLISGIPSVLNAAWYKTGFGMQFAPRNRLTNLAAQYNALFRVAFSGSSYEPDSSIFTEIEKGQKGQLGKIYKSSNWVVFVDPKVDLSFFQKSSSDEDELMIIHYSDQYTSASGYDDITVTQKSEQYNKIIFDQLQKKGVTADTTNINEIISLFNAVNGAWMLRLITAKKLTGAADSYFSREKMSILSAIKLCMAYYSHPNIVWTPISLEEMLRVSGGIGLSQKDGVLSAKNLGFERGPASDDILLVGIEGPADDIKIYLHPVEVKIGQNQQAVLNKAHDQVLNTYQGLWSALWLNSNRDNLECKLSRNFFIQLILVCCEKMKLYGIYPDEQWDWVLSDFREKLLNEQYIFSDALDSLIGKGTIVSFGTDVLNKTGTLIDDVCLLEMPEKLGSTYMVRSVKAIEDELDQEKDELPWRLKSIYYSVPTTTKQEDKTQGHQDTVQIMEQDVSQQPNSDTPASQNEPTTVNNVEPIEEEGKQSEQEKEDFYGDKVQGMQILFGTDIVTGKPLLWLPNDTNQVFHTNTGIIGTMGTGKTQFTKSLITQLYRDQTHNFDKQKLGILIFDYKGDYNESKEDFIKATNAKVLKPYHLPFNPLALTKSRVFKPLLPIHTANAFKDTLAKVYGLGPKQQNTLFQCIIDAYAANGIIAGSADTWENTPPTFNMVYNLYTNDENIKKTDSLAAAMDKLYQFQVFEGNPEATLSLFELLTQVVVIDLSGYDADIQSLIVAITLDLFYSQMQAAGSSKMNNQYRQLTKLILVDEADNFMCEGFPSLKRILKEGREFGVGTILSTQFLKNFGTGDDDYSKYILTWVVHNVADLKSSDVDFVFKTEPKSAESQSLFTDIKELKKHHSIIKIGNAKPQYIKDKAFWELYRDLNLD